MTTEPGGAEVTRLRQGMYRFFAGALLPPDAERVGSLMAAADLLEDCGIESFAYAPSWRAVGDELDRLPPVEALQAEHVRLFQAGTDGALCPPAESYYVASARDGSAARLAADVEREYRRLGLALVAEHHGVPDEVSPELELMAYLCGIEAGAREQGSPGVGEALADQGGFIERHIGRWLPLFAARVRERADAGFYPTVVHATDAFVAHDREYLAALMAAAS